MEGFIRILYLKNNFNKNLIFDKMKNNIILLLFSILAISLNTIAQLANCNPDAEGEAWWAGMIFL